MDRVLRVTAADDGCMLSALRELADRNLVQFANGLLVGPHALLHDALRELIPGSVAALIHRRIATMLELECVAEGRAPSLALASARSWLAIGNPYAATELIRSCARHAAAVGEPLAASELLCQVAGAQLPPALRAELLDDLVRYAQDGGSQSLAASSLRDRYHLARDMAEGQNALKAIELRIIEADLLNGGLVSSAVAPLISLLSDASLDASLRVQASVRLMVIADVELDIELARQTYAWLLELQASRAQAESHFLRAELVFHTAFGDLAVARQLAQQLVTTFPEPSIAQESIHARNFAAFALSRLRAFDQAVMLCVANYDFLFSHGILNEALYSAALRAEIALTDGDLSTASSWLAKAEEAARGSTPHQLSPYSGLKSNIGVLAMMQGRYSDAERLILSPDRDIFALSTARNRALSSAISLRLRQLSMSDIPQDSVIDLEALYRKGRNLGGQDFIVETLWCARILAGDTGSASALLAEYLTFHRREQSVADWSLRHTTAADDAWSSC
ncbi:MAG: hypothetical protein ABI625_06580 [bacterium]